MDRWTQIELFVRIAKLGSISGAAEEMDLSNAAASRYLVQLEKRLRVRLIERTTRRLWLTEAGTIYLSHCEAALAEMERGDAAVEEAASEPVGLLRVTTSVSFAAMHVAPALPELRRRHPALRISLLASNRYANFIESGVDVAIRTRQFEPDSGITVKRLAECRLVMAASGDYLSRRGTPRDPDELADHELLIYSLATRTETLRFERGDQVRVVDTPAAFACDDGQVIRHAALQGAGLLIQPLYILLDDLQAGRLVPVLESWSLPMLTINLAYQSRKHQPAKIRAFSAFMAERMRSFNFLQVWNDAGPGG